MRVTMAATRGIIARTLATLLVLAAILCSVGGMAQAASHPRIEPGLVQNSAAIIVPQEILSQSGVLSDDEDRLLVMIEHDREAEALSELLNELGGRLQGTYEQLLASWIPRDRLIQVAELPGVRYVRRPHFPVPLATDGPRLPTEGVVLLGASRFHATGVFGQGVTVGVIDIGFGGLTNAYRASEISPDAVLRTRDYTGDGIEKGGVHGTGVAQIVHNMAPKAGLHLARIGNEVQLAMAVQDCIDYEVDVIVHAVGWVNTNFGDGTGVIADIVRRAADAGILWVNAAGNHAQQHWIGEAYGTSGEWVELAPGIHELELTVEMPSLIQVALTWDEWPHARTDLDLFLLDIEGQKVASSQGVQQGNAPPTEYLAYWADRGEYSVRVRWEKGQEPVRLEIFSMAHELTPNAPEMSILAPGNVDKVLTVGAIALDNWNTGPQQPYSSQGPTNDGRLKPNITGPDGVTNFAYPQFWGTSAAAPHVGGAAALLLSQATRSDMTLTQEEITSILNRWAVEMGEPGPDTVYGHGRLRLFVEQAHAERRILTPLPEGRVPRGSEFSVEISLRMPASQVGGIELREELPADLQGSIESCSDAVTVTEGNTLVWNWPLLTPGEEHTVTYNVKVPEDLPVGDYIMDGWINHDPVQGASLVEVVTVDPPMEPAARSSPNPVSDGGPVRFTLEGMEAAELRLWVHDASGRTVYQSGWQPGPSYQWNLQDDGGRLVPGGVYLYWLEVRTFDGELVRSTIGKLLVLR